MKKHRGGLALTELAILRMLLEELRLPRWRLNDVNVLIFKMGS